MDFREVKELIELINSSNLAYFEYKTSDGHIKMDKSLSRNLSNNISLQEEPVLNYDKAPNENSNNINFNVATEEDSEIRKTTSEEEDSSLIIITSPMVGTFYSSPSPIKPAFINEGEEIKKGDVLCIVEAMKLMNEIESEVSGVVKKILVKDGEMVEYGQPLFKIKEN